MNRRFMEVKLDEPNQKFGKKGIKSRADIVIIIERKGRSQATSVGRTWCYFSGAVDRFCYVMGGIVEISDGGLSSGESG
jgi:hypothetical protein